MRACPPVAALPLAVVAVLAVLVPGCDDHQDQARAQQRTIGVKDRSVYENVAYGGVEGDVTAQRDAPDALGKNTLPMAARPAAREPNFWDLSTWRLDFWNAQPTPQLPPGSTGNYYLDKTLEDQRRQEAYQKQYGSTPAGQPGVVEQPRGDGPRQSVKTGDF